jgi:uncharacterized protein YegP (UPF0339 family)
MHIRFSRPKYGVEMRQGNAGDWYWRVMSTRNGQVITVSEMYSSYAAAFETARSVAKEAGWELLVLGGHPVSAVAPVTHTKLPACLALVLMLVTACAAFKQTVVVGTGAGVGAGVGALVAGPAGAIGGAIIGGSVTSAVVESDRSQARVERLEARAPQPREPEPWSPADVPWGYWLAALWVYLRRAHLADALTGKEPRMDAILRALGLRTHKTPVPGRGRRA